MRLRLLTASALLAGFVAVPGCGDDYDSSMPTIPSPPTTDTITIVGQNGAQSFSPNPASLGGQQVVFRNNDNVIHRVVLNDGTIDTGDIAPGATSRVVTMPSAGTNYHCSVHPAMIGSVSTATGAQPPPCTGDYC